MASVVLLLMLLMMWSFGAQEDQTPGNFVHSTHSGPSLKHHLIHTFLL